MYLEATPYPQPLSKDPRVDNIAGQSAFGRSSRLRVNSTYKSAIALYRVGNVAMMKDLGFVKSSIDVKQHSDLGIVQEAAARLR